MLRTLLKEARRINADYMVYNGWRNILLFDFCLAAAPRILRIPAFLYVHDVPDVWNTLESRSRLKRFVFNWLLGSMANVLTVSRWSLARLEEVGLIRGRIHVIHNGIDVREADSY